MFHPSAYWNSRPDGFPVLEVVGDEAAKTRFVPLRRSELTGRVAGPLGELTLTQVFGFSEEQNGRVIEAAYRFPLPGDAAVTGVLVRFGDVEIRAELKARDEAESDYEAAKAEGRQAALTTRESPDVFTLRVAGIQADQEVTVSTEYVLLTREERDGRRSLRVPLTTAPRYVRSDEAGSPHADGQPLALLRDPGHRFALDLTFAGGSEVTSRTHTVIGEPTDGGTMRVRLSEGEVLPDRDCVLLYRLSGGDAVGPSLQAFVHADSAPGAPVYVLAQAVAPRRTTHAETLPREVVLLVDRSGSMQGAKWEAADWAVKQFLATLTDRDTFALGLFHNTTRWMQDKPVAADARAIDAAQQFLDAHRDSGGTELGVALEQALRLAPTGSAAEERSRHVLVVTDAEVSDAGRLLRLAEGESKKDAGKRRRVSVLCIDAAPNSLLAHELAERGGGIARFLTSRPDEEDITTALEEVLEEWAAPVLFGLRLHVDRPDATSAERGAAAGAPGETTIDLGDLAAGRARWVAARIPLISRGAGDRPLTLTLTAGFGRHERVLGTLQTTEAEAREEHRPAVKSLFGARRLLSLEYLLTGDYLGEPLEAALNRLGYPADVLKRADAQEDAPLYAENRRQDEPAKALKQLLTREALEFGLASSATAFVAVRSEAGRRVEETAVVANALPDGWAGEGQFIGGLPRSSASMPMGAAPGGPPPRAAPAPMRAMMARIDILSDTQSAGGRGGAGSIGGMFGDMFGALLPKKKTGGPDVRSARARRTSDTEDEELRSNTPLNFVPPVFTGVPAFSTHGTATLYDSRVTLGALPADATLTRLTVRLPDGSTGAPDRGLILLLYVDDLAQPRATVRLADLMRQGGSRPLNLRRTGGAVVLLVLQDENGAWSAGGAPALEVSITAG